MIPERYAIGIDSAEFSEVKERLNLAIQTLMARMLGKGSNEGKINLTITMSTENFAIGDLLKSRTAVVPTIKYKLTSKIESSDSESNILHPEVEVMFDSRGVYFVPIKEQASMFDDEET